MAEVLGRHNLLASHGLEMPASFRARLPDLSVSSAPAGVSAELAVRHCIWRWFDFAGHPHPGAAEGAIALTRFEPATPKNDEPSVCGPLA